MVTQMTLNAVSSQISVDLGVTANTYASFAEIMTGFSFAALAIYLAYEASKGAHSQESKANTAQLSSREHRGTRDSDGRQKHPIEVGKEYPIRRTDVTAALFYTVASLAISSFLYASLTTQVDNAGKLAVLLLIYGTAFGISILSFFYSLTLMMYANATTSPSANAAYSVIVIVGPIVILRFLADAAQSAWNERCISLGGCRPENWTPPLTTGMVILLFLLAFSIVISKSEILERWQRMHRLCNSLCIRPVLPSRATFTLSAIVAVSAVIIAEPVNYRPSVGLIWLVLLGGSVLLALFALACGCVIGPRLQSRQGQALAPKG